MLSKGYGSKIGRELEVKLESGSDVSCYWITVSDQLRIYYFSHSNQNSEDQICHTPTECRLHAFDCSCFSPSSRLEEGHLSETNFSAKEVATHKAQYHQHPGICLENYAKTSVFFLYLVYSGNNIEKIGSEYFGASKVFTITDGSGNHTLEQLLDGIIPLNNSGRCEFGLVTSNGLTVKEGEMTILELRANELLVFEKTSTNTNTSILHMHNNRRFCWNGELTLYFHPIKHPIIFKKRFKHP